MKTQKTDWEGILRQAITKSGLSRYAIAKQGDISPAQLTRFMSGERGINFTTAEKIGKIVGVELRLRD